MFHFELHHFWLGLHLFWTGLQIRGLRFFKISLVFGFPWFQAGFCLFLMGI
jgi:hypothetical protein